MKSRTWKGWLLLAPCLLAVTVILLPVVPCIIVALVGVFAEWLADRLRGFVDRVDASGWLASWSDRMFAAAERVEVFYRRMAWPEEYAT